MTPAADKRFSVLPLLAAIALLLLAAPGADARKSIKKSIWGPVSVNGVSQFPTYRDLGAGIYHQNLVWANVAPTRPARPTDPADPAYVWPAELDQAVAEARRSRIRVSLLVQGTPPWANGGRDRRWAPRRNADFARFLKAATRRYRSVRLWMIWGEPTRRANFQPLFHERRGRKLTRKMRRGPRTYAKLLDASYRVLKRANRRNLVIGGNSFTTGDVSPRNWIRYLRLPNGKPPRMDMYGHNPFSNRRPGLRRRASGFGFADFSDLGRLGKWVDRNLRRNKRRPMKLYLSEFFLPTDNFNHEFNFFVTRRTAASWLRSALRITRRSRRIYTLGWFSLYDDPPNAKGDQVNRGLLTHDGRRKAAYRAFKRG